MSNSLPPFAPENLVSRGGFSNPDQRGSPDFSGSRNCVPIVFTAESPPVQSQ